MRPLREDLSSTEKESMWDGAPILHGSLCEGNGLSSRSLADAPLTARACQQGIDVSSFPTAQIGGTATSVLEAMLKCACPLLAPQRCRWCFCITVLGADQQSGAQDKEDFAKQIKAP